MKPWKRTVLAVGAVLALATGCGAPNEGGGSQNAGQASSAAAPVIKPFEAKVSISDISPTCREVTCWLPTQWEPKLVKGETVGLRDKWPMDGMTVLVLCETGGETYRDQTGQESNAWYGILVPTDKLEPLESGAGPKSLPVDGGYIGYVGAAWINGGHDKQAPYC
jgi:hypothetical protein